MAATFVAAILVYKVLRLFIITIRKHLAYFFNNNIRENLRTFVI